MTFRDFIFSVPIDEVKLALADLYFEDWGGDKDSFINYHLKVLDQVKNIKPEPNGLILDIIYMADHTRSVIYEEKYPMDGLDYYSVTAHDPSELFEGESYHHAIEFTPWGKWLGMKMSVSSLYYPRGKVLANALFEMTFISNDPDEIQGQWDKLKLIAENVTKCT